MQGDTVAELEKTLDAEYVVLRRVELADLARFAEQKQRLLSALADAGISDPARLKVLGVKARRNAAYLDALLRGIRSARARLDDLQEAARGLRTYDRFGQRSGPIGGSGALELRA